MTSPISIEMTGDILGGMNDGKTTGVHKKTGRKITGI